MSTIWRVSGYLFKYRRLFVATLLLAVGSTVFLIAVPQIIKWIVDVIVASGDTTLLLWGVTAIIGCYFGRDLLNCLRIRINNTLEQKVLIDLRSDLHRKLLDLPIGYYDKRKSGEIASRVIEDVQNVERVILDGSEQGIVAVGLQHRLPVMFGVLTCDDGAQAFDRAGGAHGNKGADVALDALRMIDLLRQIRPSQAAARAIVGGAAS